MTAPFVVIGAGVAGCVAARTLADAGKDIVLLEAGPGPRRPPELERLDHLGSTAASDWWFPDAPRRGRGAGGSSAVNGMVLDAIDPLDRRRWGWGDDPEQLLADEVWVLDRWTHTEVESGPFTMVFGDCVTRGFPRTGPTAASGDQGWRPLSLAWTDGRRVSAADAFLEPGAVDVSYNTEVAVIEGDAVVTTEGRRIEASHVFLAAGVIGSPRLLVASGLLDAELATPPLNHPSTAIIVELEPALRVDPGTDHPPSSRLLRTATGLSENTVDLQILVLDHTGADRAGRAHAAVIVTALEPDRQKVLVAGITQVLHWLREIDGVSNVSISNDQTPVQHQCCSLTDLPTPPGPITPIDASVLPALPHTNPMVSIAVGARRKVLELL